MRVAHLSAVPTVEDDVVVGVPHHVREVVRALNAAAVEAGRTVESEVLWTGSDLGNRDLTIIILEELSATGSSPAGLIDAVRPFDLVHIHDGFTSFGAYCAALVATARVPFVLSDAGGTPSPIMMRGGAALAAGVLARSEELLPHLPSDPGVIRAAISEPVNGALLLAFYDRALLVGGPR